MTTYQSKDHNGNEITRPEVWVGVGSGAVMRPGRIEKETKTALLVTFIWGNGRVTKNRRFRFDNAEGRAFGVVRLEDSELSSWAMAYGSAQRAANPEPGTTSLQELLP